MKDSYSFDLDDAGLMRSYRAHRDAYERIFTRLGLDYHIVAALSGAMGGSESEEFLAPTAAGEDTFVHCPACDYAGQHRGRPDRRGRPAAAPGSHPASRTLDTPGTPTIASLVACLNDLGLDQVYTAADTLKNLVVRVRRPGQDGWSLLVIGVPGRPGGRPGPGGGPTRARGRSNRRDRTTWPPIPAWWPATSARRS